MEKYLILLLLILAISIFVLQPTLDSNYQCNDLTHIWAILSSLLLLLIPNAMLTKITAVSLLSFHLGSIFNSCA